MMATAGLKPCATTGEPSGRTNGCGLCEAPADGYDAAFGGALCRECADAFGDLCSDVREVRDE
ncbi:hypothetical protein [Halorubrum sp. Ib24]|uniref:hypothetical protein n=1 Tax=Halorubrum sp. Ib24 TaxID=1383850 RepID=UPI00117A9D01|nr:hypothetical protein [Halorubrum sp. Ib24]